MDPEPIDPKSLIEELGVEGLNRYSDEYYKRLYDSNIQLGKPFSMFEQTPQLLVRLGLILESLRLKPGMKVLDFGAGTCWISKALWQMGCSVVATDVSEEALRLGRTLFEEYPIPNTPPCSWQTRLFDGFRIPCEDEEIDRIVCFDAFHHVPNPEAIAKEFHRVLRNGGKIGFNEPIGDHSTSTDSQREMRDYKVLENDLDMPTLKMWFCDAGFQPPTFKAAVNPDYFLEYDQWQRCAAGEVLKTTGTALSEFARVSGIFFFQKGNPLNDSRQMDGLAHTLTVDAKRLDLTVGESKRACVSVRNTGENRWLCQNEAHIGVVHIASRLFDYDSMELVCDNTRFRIPHEMEPGDQFEGDIPLSAKRPGRYWLKLDLVSETVCWFESLGSKPALVEVNVSS